MTDLDKRVEALELATKALASNQFGAQDGHPFYGNQYTDGSGGGGKDEDDGSGNDGWQAKSAGDKVDMSEIKPEADLSGRDLSGMDLTGANLRNADLSDAIMFDANLTDANLSGAMLPGANLNDANLSRANLEDANLSDSQLNNADLHGANLINADLDGASLVDADLSNANAEGANFNNANLDGASTEGTNFNNANLDDDDYLTDVEPPVEAETSSSDGVKFPDIEVQLTGEDGNAFAVIGAVMKALKQNGLKDEADQFMEEATSGDYDHLLQTAMSYVNVS
jgi:uncharacterized protein YjbI with pentapeptide repeats